MYMYVPIVWWQETVLNIASALSTFDWLIDWEEVKYIYHTIPWPLGTFESCNM